MLAPTRLTSCFSARISHSLQSGSSRQCNLWNLLSWSGFFFLPAWTALYDASCWHPSIWRLSTDRRSHIVAYPTSTWLVNWSRLRNWGRQVPEKVGKCRSEKGYIWIKKCQIVWKMHVSGNARRPKLQRMCEIQFLTYLPSFFSSTAS